MESIKIETSRITKKALWIVYAIAFLLLIGSITTSHFVADRIVQKQNLYASVIDISGRQLMLSQRITGLIVETFLLPNSLERNLLIHRIDQSIDLMDESHRSLTDNGHEAVTEATTQLYFSSASNIDSQVMAFLTEARRLRNLAANEQQANPSELRLFAEQGFSYLLPQLNSVLEHYQLDAEEKLTGLRQLNIGLWLFTLGVICLELLMIFRPLIRRLDEMQRELESIGHTDPLTGCWNRSALMKDGNMMWSLSRRQNRSFSVIICNIDNFKRINDTYGHGIGDEAIIEFAQTCLEGLRDSDLYGRVGGEEFIIILPYTETSGAAAVAERIRKAQEVKTVDTQGVSFKMTASFGVAKIGPDDNTLQSLIDLAYQALYSAKENGRNRVEVFTR